jgi:hypothetical protein
MSIRLSRFIASAMVAVAVIITPVVRGAATAPPDQPVLVDTSASAGGVVASSSSSATYSADHAFDGNWSDNAGRWLAYTNPGNDYGEGIHGETPMYLVYKFNVPTKVNILRLRIQNANEWDKRSPKTWTFLGSNDGSTWTQLDSRSGVAWASGTLVKSFAFENQTAYEYYKFSCTEIIGENNYLQIYEIQFLYDAGIVLTDLTSPSGTITTTTSGDWVKPAKNAFDNGTGHNNDDRSIHSGTTVDWIYTFEEPTKVNAYKVYVPGTGPYFYDKRMPKNWTFEAKNAADATWTILDTQSDETGWSALESRYYEFRNTTAYDSYRFAVTANQAGSDAYIQIDELEFFFVNRDGPEIGLTSLTRTGALAYSLTATEAANAADLSYILDDGATVTTNGTQSVAEGGSVSWPISGQLADTTYQVTVYAENAADSASEVAGTFYTGELSLGATTNANENGLVAGGVVVSRATADPFPLAVNYTISGSAGAEGTTWAAPVSVTIPADATSTILPVMPVLDPDVVADITITVTLATGNYELPAVSSKTLTLVNLVAPSGYNTWVAPVAGLASVASNWSEGHVPTAQEDVLFDGRFANANCTWDAPTTVGSWTQTADYAGTVEIQTTYADGAFPLLSITGDCTVNGGKWTHASNTNIASNAAAQDRLNVSVGGDFTLGASAKIDVIGRGYNVGRCPAGSQVGVHAASARGTYSAVYGNVLAPEDIGSGGESGNKNTSSGGGAVKLTVAGAAVIDGTVAANAASQRLAGANPEKGFGAGGSIFITASSISGSGTVDVSARPAGVSETAYTSYAGSGGRMALVATSGNVTIPMANLRADGSWGGYSAGAGTIFLKNSTDTNGSLLIGNNAISWSFAVRYVRKDGCTCVKPGETWTFDHVYVRDYGILSVPPNATLVLPGGIESISSLTDSSAPFCGILYLGGTISLPVRQEHVLSGPWMFMAAVPFTFAGDVRLISKASIGSFQLYADSVAAYPACTVAVTGDMTVESGASLYANNRGRRGADSTPTMGYHGGSVASTSNHQSVYDSILSPSLCGTGGRNGDMGNTNPGGGAIVLTVGGCLTLNGNANAGTGRVVDYHFGAAGTINITAGSLTGTGAISANGVASNGKSRGAGAGGRVAVRLTDAGATFADFSGTIKAEGNNGNSATPAYGSSAGTVYLQDGNTAEGAGTVRVANLPTSTAADARTGFPSLSNGVAVDDLSKTTLEIANNSRVVLIADVEVEAINIGAGSMIDLNGHSIIVRAAHAGGVKVPPGIYADGATFPIGAGTLDDYLLDTATGGGGSLIVRSRATFILLQ